MYKTVLGLFLAANLGFAQAAIPSQINGQPLPSLADMVEQVTPAVVNISTRSKVSISQNPLFNDPFFRRFFDIPNQPQQSRPQSLGSGVVIDADKGYIITNHHVVGRADEITITLRDGRELQAKLLGSDPEADVALLQVPAKDLTSIKLADSNALRVGDFVVAIGNPFGLGQTVTSGIVSALGRSGLGIEGYEDFIQTDASINPGNSGGALVNLNGELVGMNTAIIAPGGSGGNVGIGFAIPINMVQQIISQLVEHGEVQRGVLGVLTQDLTVDLAQAFNLKKRKGAVISKVLPDSAAALAGLKVGDVVVEVNGRKIKNSMDMRNAIGLVRIGQNLKIRLLRNGEAMTLEAKIQQPKQQSIAGEKISPRLSGAVIGELPNTDDESINHLVILDVAQGSPAWYARLRKGDEILSVNRKPVKNLEQLKKFSGRGQLLLNIQRGGTALFILLK